MFNCSRTRAWIFDFLLEVEKSDQRPDQPKYLTNQVYITFGLVIGLLLSSTWILGRRTIYPVVRGYVS